MRSDPEDTLETPNYDKVAGTFYCYLLLVTGLAVIPFSYHLLWSKFRKIKALFYFSLLILGWFLMLYFHHRAVNSKHTELNPYQILQIDPSTPQKQMEEAYRRLRLRVCPEMTQENRETCEEIKKAYKVVINHRTNMNSMMDYSPSELKSTTSVVLFPGFCVCILVLYAVVYMYVVQKFGYYT